MFVFVGCDDGWVPYKHNCYWFSRGTDLVFHNAVVRFKWIPICLIADISKRLLNQVKLSDVFIINENAFADILAVLTRCYSSF